MDIQKINSVHMNTLSRSLSSSIYEDMPKDFQYRVSQDEFKSIVSMINMIAKDSKKMENMVHSVTLGRDGQMAIEFKRKSLHGLINRSCAIYLSPDQQPSLIIETKSKLAGGQSMPNDQKRGQSAQGYFKKGKPCYILTPDHAGKLSVAKGFSLSLKPPFKHNKAHQDGLDRELKLKKQYWGPGLTYHLKGKSNYWEVKGDDLSNYMKKNPRLSLDKRLSIITELASSIESVHRQGQVHADIKPDNIIFISGKALLNDFGNTKSIGEPLGQAMTWDYTPRSKGRPMHQIPDVKWADTRHDLYAFAKCITEQIIPLSYVNSLQGSERKQAWVLYKQAKSMQMVGNIQNHNGHIDKRLTDRVDVFMSRLSDGEVEKITDRDVITSKPKTSHSQPKTDHNIMKTVSVKNLEEYHATPQKMVDNHKDDTKKRKHIPKSSNVKRDQSTHNKNVLGMFHDESSDVNDRLKLLVSQIEQGNTSLAIKSIQKLSEKDITSFKQHGKSLLHIAMEHHQVPVVKVLIERIPHETLISTTSDKPLTDVAREHNMPTEIQRLLQHGNHELKP
ncbi:MAG: serine/threonine-protein kinase [Pseudomonadota bacterium]|nr:serine/threonine-protein kinase [Pseudomonadota bacterium]